jgi:curved DNA-binding protein CbpA
MKDYHSILGVNPWASQDEIKQAYRRLASKFHPDHGGDREKFQQIQTAYQNLSDTSKKKFSDIPIDRSPPFFHQNLHSTFDFFNRETRPRTTKISLWLDLRDLLTPQKKVVSVVTGRGAIHNVEIDIPVKLDDGQAVR